MDDAEPSRPNPTAGLGALAGNTAGAPSESMSPNENPVPIEIERRFLIRDPTTISLGPANHIRQWYLPKNAIVRVGNQILISAIQVAEIKSLAWLDAFDSILNTDNPTVRIRITKQEAILCIKGRPDIMMKRSSLMGNKQGFQSSKIVGDEDLSKVRNDIDITADETTEGGAGKGEGEYAAEDTGVGSIGRLEMEWQLDLEVATSIVQSTNWPAIKKTRHLVASELDMTWEIDRFLGHHEGLWIAEIELSNEDDNFESPDWLGEEVTGQFQYTNQHLACNI